MHTINIYNYNYIEYEKIWTDTQESVDGSYPLGSEMRVE
jgi:hypothetical protein